MNIGPSVKPVSAARASYAKSESLSMRTTVATELPPSQAVTVADGAPSAGHDAARAALDWSSMSREGLIDPQTREVIYRAIARRAGRPDDQTPEEATLKLKAYQSAELRRDADGRMVERTI
jgi:hypothetical protein